MDAQEKIRDANRRYEETRRKEMIEGWIAAAKTGPTPTLEEAVAEMHRVVDNEKHAIERALTCMWGAAVEVLDSDYYSYRMELEKHLNDSRDPTAKLLFTALIKLLQQRTKPLDVAVPIGDFEVKSGSLVVSDPCYTRDTWCNDVVENTKNGGWKARVRYNDDWGIRPFALMVYHADHPAAMPLSGDKPEEYGWSRTEVHVGVDSGQAGAFDNATFRSDDVVKDLEIEWGHDEDDGERWYGACCDQTLGDMGAGVVPGGAVSSSGFGDGGYACYTQKADGQVTAVLIDFMGVNDDE